MTAVTQHIDREEFEGERPSPRSGHIWLPMTRSLSKLPTLRRVIFYRYFPRRWSLVDRLESCGSDGAKGSWIVSGPDFGTIELPNAEALATFVLAEVPIGTPSR